MCFYQDNDGMKQIHHPFGSKEQRTIVIARGLFGGFGLLLYFYTISALPLGDAQTMLSLNPVVTVLVAAPLLGEPLLRTHLIAAAASVIGSILLAQPSLLFGSDGDEMEELDDDGTSKTNWGYLTGLLGSCVGAGVYILIRKAGEVGAPTLSLLLSWCVFSLIYSSILLSATTGLIWPSSGLIWFYAFMACSFGSLGHLMMNYAGRLAPAGLAAIIRSSGILWSYVIDILVFQTIPKWLTVLGVSLILISLSIIAIEKHQEYRKHEQQDLLENVHDPEGGDTRYGTLQPVGDHRDEHQGLGKQA